MPEEENVNAQGERTVAVGSHASGNNIYTGNVYNYLLNTPGKLQQPIPSLFPYSVNRNEQESKLREEIKKPSPYPLICIIHGDEYQSHDTFSSRLEKLLPQLLEQEKITRYLLRFPSQRKNSKEFSDYLRNELAVNIGIEYASLKEINDYFYKLSPIVIKIFLLTEDLQSQGLESLHQLLEFWQEWPSLYNNQKIIICIFIRYQIKPINFKDYGIIKLFSFLSDLFKQYHYDKINKKISQQINSPSNFNKFNRLSGLVLPQLTGVNRRDVEYWVRMEFGEEITHELIREIGELFNKWETQNSSKEIPMDDLAKKLIELLKSNYYVKEK
jgi:hypothetical protein